MMTKTINADPKQQFKLSMLAMTLFGVGELVGCFFIGYFVDKLGSKICTILNLLIAMTMFILTFINIWQYEFSWLAFFMCFFWGFQDSAVNTHT